MALLGIPIGLPGIEVLGFSVSGWAWATAVGVGLMAAIAVPLPSAAVRLCLPLLAYLAFDFFSLVWTPAFGQGMQVVIKYAGVAVVYLVAYRAADFDPDILTKLRTWALIIFPSVGFVFIRAAGDSASTLGWLKGGNGARPMVMLVALLYLVSTIGRSRRFAISMGLVALSVSAASGGRMGTAVVGVMVVLNPALRLTWRARILIILGAVMLFAAALQLEPIQERFFHGQTVGTLEDIVALEGNFNTAGRGNNWPVLLDSCNQQPTWGHGAGAASLITLEATNGRTGHPHNEFIRIYCESGMVGVLLFWSFFIAAGLRGLAALRRQTEIGGLAALAILALVLFSITDNATVYTGVFMLPLAILIGIADRASDSSRPAVRVPEQRGW